MLRFYNTLSQKKETFKPLKKGKVNIFVCGPTVYDFSHLGHARTYIVFDALTKFLRQRGFEVFYLQNITDIDDKIIQRAKEEKIFWKALSKKFEKEYLKDMRKVFVDSVTKYARASEHIKEIISQVNRLIKKKNAYFTNEGIYYDISKFKDYGKLSKRTVLQAEDAVSRIDEAVEKKNKGDFCLWKFSKKDEPFWQSPWGKGRPGWHIEDTAIAEKYFGFQYDIHGGAKDLIFPHHEAEIAQMEAISAKKPMVKYWLHTGFLTVKGKKMSKSLGNFITLTDFLKNYSGRLLRYLILKFHYRSFVDFDEKLLKQAKIELEKIDDFIEKIKKIKFKTTKDQNLSKKIKKLIDDSEKEFNEALNDDFNTPKAIGIIFRLIHKLNNLISEDKLNSALAKKTIEFLKRVDITFCFIFAKKEKKEKFPPAVLKLVQEREIARKEQNWILADKLREKIKEFGYQIEDTSDGPRLKKII